MSEKIKTYALLTVGDVESLKNSRVGMVECFRHCCHSQTAVEVNGVIDGETEVYRVTLEKV